jgi:hypothetical protein
MVHLGFFAVLFFWRNSSCSHMYTAAASAASCRALALHAVHQGLPADRGRRCRHAAAAAPKTTPGLWDALAFSGPVPERINGRLAIVGFVSRRRPPLASRQRRESRVVRVHRRRPVRRVSGADAPGGERREQERRAHDRQRRRWRSTYLAASPTSAAASILFLDA